MEAAPRSDMARTTRVQPYGVTRERPWASNERFGIIWRGNLAGVALVHKSADGRRSAALAVFQAVRGDTGIPSRVIRLSTAQANRASVFWLGRVRARRPRPMITL